jgi:hypothetical protein
MAFFNVLHKVGHGFRRFIGVQLQDDVAVVRAQFDFGHCKNRSF